MDDTTKIGLASAVAGGYLLGRTKKGRLALSLAMMLAGREASAQPRQLASQAAEWLGGVPEVAQLRDQLRQEGTDAARNVMTSLAERGAGSLADVISSRTAVPGDKPGETATDSDDDASGSERDDDGDGDLSEESDEEQEADGADEEPEEGADEEAEEPEEEQGEREPEPSGGRRGVPRAERSEPARKSAPARESSRTEKTAKSAPAGKTAAKKTGSATRNNPRR
ncbi:histone protein [Streptomyces sp. P38-E01]|uniref:Histone protein n=1 Tax=Streptomyces tardus TaxID=2780544 RepID=A0A949JE21_9ACTN|nr:histone protein [Streptomyces tardus]MBU7596835.1 histone protein [Streptomyces tardus]